MSPQRPRSAYDRWRDAQGVHIPEGCRVEQVEVAKEYGALLCRLRKRGDVVGRSRGNRLYVRFDGEDGHISIRPHLVQVLAETPPLITEHIIDQLEQLRELVPAPTGDGVDHTATDGTTW